MSSPSGYFADRYPRSWAQTYLHSRFGDHPGLAGFRPGFAPAGWTGLVQHLRRHHVTDQEMLTAGVAAQTRDNRLIDRFRNRVTLPITADGDRFSGSSPAATPTSATSTTPDPNTSTPPTPSSTTKAPSSTETRAPSRRVWCR